MGAAKATFQNDAVTHRDDASWPRGKLERRERPTQRETSPGIWNVGAEPGLVKQEVTMTKTSDHGITRVRGEDQPADKERAQQAQKIELGHTPPVVREEANDRD